MAEDLREASTLRRWIGAAKPRSCVSRAAVTDAFPAQRRYKRYLHHALWRGGACAAMMLACRHLL